MSSEVIRRVQVLLVSVLRVALSHEFLQVKALFLNLLQLHACSHSLRVWNTDHLLISSLVLNWLVLLLLLSLIKGSELLVLFIAGNTLPSADANLLDKPSVGQAAHDAFDLLCLGSLLLEHL